MRKIIFACGCTIILVVFALFGARGREQQAAKLRLQLVDAETGRPLGGIVRIVPADGTKPVELPNLLDRLRGLKKTEVLSGWYVVPAAGADTRLSKGRYRVESVSGLETARANQEIDVSGDSQDLTLKLSTLFRPEAQKFVAGNTHLHLQGLTKTECEEYLRQAPAAEGIKVMFISYLERAEIDKAYITNTYPIGDLKQFAATGVLFNNGEEHRHNFEAWGQGFGHVMFLDLKELVKPVSLGPGITARGDDDRPLRPGIDEARKQGATVIWCHNELGHEDVPNVLSGRLDALNVFDGNRVGTFEQNYYHYLNVGIRLPISTGTDWFLYDFSRVYAHVQGSLTVKSWLDALKAGRTCATNGPMLTMSVEGRPIGDVINLEKPGGLRIVAHGIGRHDFQRLQIVHNGRVIHQVDASKRNNGFEAHFVGNVRVDGPGWVAVRIESDTKNELQQQLFAHTSPVYVDMQNIRRFDVESARELLKQMERSRDEIRSRGKFSDDDARMKLLLNYDDAIRDLTDRINRRR